MPTKIVTSTITILLAFFVMPLSSLAADIQTQATEQSVFQDSSHLSSEQFKQRKRKEERAVVGQPFSPFLKAQDASGLEVTIRDILHGPSVVIQLGVDSSLADSLLAYLRKHGSDYANRHHVQVVVVVTDYYGNQDYVDMLAGLPESIIALHVSGPLIMDMYSNPVLGGSISPVTLFLNKDLVVVDRHLGTTVGDPERTLTSKDAFQ